jgi:hypothetical protein
MPSVQAKIEYTIQVSAKELNRIKRALLRSEDPEDRELAGALITQKDAFHRSMFERMLRENGAEV